MSGDFHVLLRPEPKIRHRQLVDAGRWLVGMVELAGKDPAIVYPGTAIHLRSCPGCRADHDGLLEAARRFSDIDPA